MRDESSFVFSGPFKDVIPAYIQHKHAIGYKVAASELYRLRELDRFFQERGVTDPVITKAMYDDWTALREGQRPVMVTRRQICIRGLGKFLRSSGYKNIYTGEDDKRSFQSDFIPYIFSKEEIDRMFQAMKKKCQECPTYLNHSFRMLMSLYYCCGLRKSEAQQLCVRDIDFRSGKITILQSKGNVSRIVVASATLLDELQDYNESYCSESLPTDPFVKSSTGGLFATGTLYDAFHALLKEAGIPKRTDGRLQRLHDIRHTFCVHTLEQMQEKGFDLYTSLPLLCAYLGHKHVKETEYYLHFVEEYHGSVLDKTAACSPFPYEEGCES